MASIALSAYMTVACTPEAAFALLCDVRRHPEIFATKQTMHNYPPPPLQVGQRWQGQTRFMGRDVVTNYSVIACETNQALALRARASVVDAEMRWLLEPVPEGVKISYKLRAEPQGFMARTAASAAKGRMGEQIRQQMTQLKALLEAPPTNPGASAC